MCTEVDYLKGEEAPGGKNGGRLGPPDINDEVFADAMGIAAVQRGNFAVGHEDSTESDRAERRTKTISRTTCSWEAMSSVPTNGRTIGFRRTETRAKCVRNLIT